MSCHNRPHTPVFDIVNLSNDTLVSNAPVVACAPNGRVTVGWVKVSSECENVWLVERNTAGIWGEPYNLTGNEVQDRASRGTSLCYDRFGRLHVAWSQATPDWVIVYARREADGTWSVSDTIRYGVAVAPTIRTDDSGRAHLLFEDLRSGLARVCYTLRNTSGVWDSVARVNETNTATFSTMCVFGDGAAIAAWQEDMSSPFQVYAAVKTADGHWRAPERIYSAPKDCFTPHLAVQGGTAYAAFGEATVDTSRIPVVAFRSGNWAEVDTTCPVKAPSFVSVAIGEGGDVYVACGDYRHPVLRLLRRRAGVWGGPVFVVDTLYPYNIDMAVGSAGTLHLVCEARTDSSDQRDVFYVELRPAGLF
jgi:hypothetical protein